MLQFPLWLRILLWVLRTLAVSKPPINGELDELEGDK